MEFKKTRNAYCGPSGKYNAGNGSLMRLAPVPLFYRNNPQMGIVMSGESSRTTHQTPLAIDACRYLGALIIGALQEKSKVEIISPLYSPTCGEVVNGSFKRINPPYIRASGYVPKTLEAALWAFYNSALKKDV